MKVLIEIEDKHRPNIEKKFNGKGTTDGIFDYLKNVEKVSVEIIPDKKRYRIWLKDGQSFCIKADKCAYNGDEIIFFNGVEDIASFRLDNIAGWTKTDALTMEVEAE